MIKLYPKKILIQNFTYFTYFTDFCLVFGNMAMSIAPVIYQSLILTQEESQHQTQS